jgi:hypothetical protein
MSTGLASIRIGGFGGYRDHEGKASSVSDDLWELVALW